MSENLLLSLLITLIGMSLVFGTILLLWWLMYTLTRLTAPPKPQVSAHEKAESERKARAAAVAVAIALAEQAQNQVSRFPMPPTAIISAWQLGMRTRQMTQKGNMR